MHTFVERGTLLSCAGVGLTAGEEEQEGLEESQARFQDEEEVEDECLVMVTLNNSLSLSHGHTPTTTY